MQCTREPRIRVFKIWFWALLGVLFGLSAYTFTYAEGASYLSDNPADCLNCHVMREQFDGWSHNSHQSVATCNDCHTPHTFPDKWVVKAINGWNHSLAFTTGNYPNTIRIRAFNAEIVRRNCIECHLTLVSNMHIDENSKGLTCASCHSDVGH